MKKQFTSLAIVAALAIAASFAAYASAPPDTVLTSVNAPAEQMAVVDVAQADVVVHAVMVSAPVALASHDGRGTVDPVQLSTLLRYVDDVPALAASPPLRIGSPPAPPLRI